MSNQNAQRDYGMGVDIQTIINPRRWNFPWRNNGGYEPDSGIHGPSGTGINAYRSPVIPRVGAVAPVLFGARSRVGY